MSKELEDLVTRIKFLKRWNVDQVAQSIGYSRVHLTREMKKEEDSPLTGMLRDKHKNLLHNDTTGSKEDYVTRRRDLKEQQTGKKQIPYYDAEASAGLIQTEMNPIHAPSGTIDVGDLLNDSQAAIRIYGNSMIPNYPPGCVVGLVKVTSSFIQPGEVYVIETADQRLLKRLFYKDDDPDSDFITCYSDNPMKFENGGRHGKVAYPPFNIHKRDIIHLFAVTGVIKRNTNSVIINR